MKTVLITLAFLRPPALPIDSLIDEAARTGRALACGCVAERLADPQKMVAPGLPPLLAFRYFAGTERYRFGKLDVMVDDAGH